MKTVQEDPPSKEKILDAAQELMIAKGFVATTLDEVCEASGVSKGCLFYYFKNKEDLGRATLERYVGKIAEMKQGALSQIKDEEIDPLERVFNYVDFMIAMVQKSGSKGGCLIGTFAQEISQTHPQLREVCQEGFTQIAQSVIEDLEEAKIKYKLKKSVNTQSLANFFVSIAQGSMLLVKTHQNTDIFVNNLEYFKQHLKFIFKKGKNS